MEIKIISEKTDAERFNNLAINPLQSWEWGEARKKMGIEVLRLGEFSARGGSSSERDKEFALKNVFQLTFHKIPYTRFTIGYLPRSVIPSRQVLDFLKNEAKKRNCIFIKIEPYVISSNVKAQDSKFQRKTESDLTIKQLNNVTISSHPLFPSWTQLIDLTKSEDELLKNMHQKTRYNIRLAEKKGVEIREMTNDEGFGIFAKLYFDTCRRQGYRGHTYKYHQIIFETLKDKIAHIFVAFYPEKGKMTPLSSFELFTFNDVCYYPYGGSALENRNLMGANLLMWEAIKFAKRSGAKKFDMWGSLGLEYKELSSVGPSTELRTNLNKDWIGFTRFKEGYGTEFVEFVESFDLVINQLLYTGYNIVNAIRKKIL
ncbi:hypothetical protein A3C23_03080 [Candidatus Roizmanbacteria bacterium RIFCSPHIGHO2_02_FULL_37_13b]|uniref:BioF2-like acetyltransferase domain-containing protein n=1 Tax=Candidatus Roizmanbacteria bacterium RIFCSPLOWO2_02_FULL_36_11 TaxID=1802071 RepID=A0A1F7JI95_9BACT|nr:MAG: hypothetical protein A3C23_03080 [Candidatus Roizmanbacteria bacterium RIFCSPHIGHO2_02_FULL_37_13b]OGK55334.1 MAG: hypothetical protein A3H78_04515 [Candidatus Roizmanbacteria bacterium RIFCSPLOWO2_02_FULL_36_11]